MDTFDELAQMDDPVPMSAQTPTEYTFINKWFIDDESAKYLQGGAIKTSGYSGEVQVLTLQASGYTNCVASDVGKMVTDDAANTGNLLTYNNTTRKWWIRWTSTIASGSVMAITAGTGAGTASAASVSGEDLYANIYTLGTITSDPSAQVYIFQAGSAIAEWSNLSNWDRGHVDILVKVKEAGTEIDGANITVFARQYGDLYDHFDIDLTSGGRNAVPLATSVDLDNTTGEFYLAFDARSVSFVTQTIVTGSTSGATAEIRAISNWTATANTGLLTLGDIKSTFQDNEGIGASTGSATVNGTRGDTYLSYDAETQAFVVGGLCVGSSTGARRTIRGVQDDGTAGKLILEANVNYESNSTYYLSYNDNEGIGGSSGGSATGDGASTTLTGGYRDIGIWFMNGELPVTSNSTFTVGAVLTGWSSAGKGVILEKVSTNKLYVGSVTTAFKSGEGCFDTASGSSTTTGTLSGSSIITKAFEQATTKNYNVIVECRSRPLTAIYEYFKRVCGEDSTFATVIVTNSGTLTTLDGEEYIAADTDYSPKKTSPLATFAGGTMFGARGVWLQNMATADVQKYQLIDADGNTQNPPNKQALTVTSVSSGDRVSVFRTTSGDIDKSTYRSHQSFNTIGSFLFTLQSTIAVDTPSTGFLRVVDASASTEQRYDYWSWSSSVLDLSTSLTVTYVSADTAYIPFIDKQATSNQVAVTVIYTADRPVLARVRRKGILPFEIAGTYGSTGLTISAIRTDDAIVT